MTVTVSPHRGVLTRPDRLAPFLLGAILFASLFLQRFVIKFGTREISFSFLVTIGCIGLLAVLGELRVDATRLFLYCMTALALFATVAMGSSGTTSPTSFALLLVLYSCYVFAFPPQRDRFRFAIELFRLFASIIAVAGILQFFGQVALPGPTLFTFDWFLPKSILTQGYAYVNPVGALPLNRSNGFFLLEASTFSQVMAMAILIELLFFASWVRLALFGAGLLVSYSGTGIILLSVFAPLIALRRGNFLLIFGGIVVLLLVVLFADALHLSAITQRAGEFGSTQSSGFARFLSPFYLLDDFVFRSSHTTLFGLGPGAIDAYFNRTAYLIHDPTWGKLFFEYGLIGFSALMGFMLWCLFFRTASAWLSGALFLNYLILGGYLLDQKVHALTLVLLALHPGAHAPWTRGKQPDPDRL